MNGDFGLVFRVTIYGKTGKHTSGMHHLELFFDLNLMVMSDRCSEWPYMAKLANIQVLYIIWSHFSIQLVTSKPCNYTGALQEFIRKAVVVLIQHT